MYRRHTGTRMAKALQKSMSGWALPSLTVTKRANPFVQWPETMYKRVYICSTKIGVPLINIFYISDYLFDSLTCHNLSIESEAGFGM